MPHPLQCFKRIEQFLCKNVLSRGLLLRYYTTVCLLQTGSDIMYKQLILFNSC